MPRKKWIPKNRYCRRSKLDEEEFDYLLNLYFSEIFYGFTREVCSEEFLRGCYLDRPSYNAKHFSRQAIFVYFKRIGQYIWDNFVVIDNPVLAEPFVLDELLDLIHGKIDSITIHKEAYDSLYKYPLYINTDNLIRSLLFYLLSQRSKNTRGLNKKTFYLEFSRVYFIYVATKESRKELPSIYSSLEFMWRDLLRLDAMGHLEKALIKKPL